MIRQPAARPDRSQSELHVVLGAHGAVGSALVRALLARGTPVRAVVRDAGRPLPEGVERVICDARDAAGLSAACVGAAVVHHAVNVPYPEWDAVMLPVTRAAIRAAAAAGAVLTLPGNVYGYGPLPPDGVADDHPLAATTRKGRLRNALEAELWAAHQAGQVSVVVARMPDFYGPGVRHKGAAMLFDTLRAGKPAAWIGGPDLHHQFIYIDDAAQALIALAETPDTHGRAWHVAGPPALTVRAFVGLAAEAAGAPARIRVLPGWAVKALGLFSPMLREVGEMLYLWQAPQIVLQADFQARFPGFAFTPHAQGTAYTVAWWQAQADGGRDAAAA
ncbi:MAG: NAD-dependent epimerase/dehydratase family protein [Myxococcales bacterium]|nr:NAD-dependent epimerase/dehydratase family protein [Myxococcales bacterium]